MPPWLHDWWPLIAFAVTVIVLPGLRWALRKGLVSQEDLKKARQEARDELDAMKERVATLEKAVERMPTRDEMHQLSLMMGQMSGRLDVMAAQIEEHHGEYHDALETLKTPVNMILQHLLQQAGKDRGS